MAEDASELTRRHSEARTHREKAEIEHLLTFAMNAERRELVVILQGSSIYEVELRSFIRSAKSELAWKLIDEEKIAPATVLGLLRKAKKVAKRSGTDLDSALATEFEDARRNQRSVRGQDGTTIFKKDMRARTVDDWKEMRAAVESLVSRELKELDPIEKEAVILDLRVELDVLIRQYGARIRAKAARGLRSGWSEATARRRLLKDLREIGVDPPKPGRMPDMDELRRAHRRELADCHPDRHPGNEHMAEKFLRVDAAYRSVLEYVNSVKEE